MKTRSAVSLMIALQLAAPLAQAQSRIQPNTLYSISADGSLKWYRHDGALTAGGLYDAGSWGAPSGKEVGVGWNSLQSVFAVPGGVIYGVTPNGDLKWYKHTGSKMGLGLYDAGSWDPNSGKVIGTGWNGFRQLFATSDGIIYGIKPDGSLRWYKHDGQQTGNGLFDPSGGWDPKSGKEVGVGWNTFKQVFAAPGGIIYGVMPNGDLKWYKHTAYRSGGGLNEANSWNAKSGKVIGTGWNFAHLIAGQNGIIYGVKTDGSLRWYKHDGQRTGDGLFDPTGWDPRGGKEIGVGWNMPQIFGF